MASPFFYLAQIQNSFAQVRSTAFMWNQAKKFPANTGTTNSNIEN